MRKLVLLFTVIVVGCSIGENSIDIDNEIEIKEGIGLTKKEEFSSLIRINNTLFLGGENTYSSLIVKSTDNGLSWQSMYSNSNGKISLLSGFNTSLYAVENVKENGKLYSKLMFCDLSSNQWEELNYGKGIIRNVYFLDSLNGLIFAKIENKKKTLKTNDGGHNWEDVNAFKLNNVVEYDNLVSKDSFLYGYYYPTPKMDSLGIFSLNIKTNELKKTIIYSEQILQKKLENQDDKLILSLFRNDSIIKLSLNYDFSIDKKEGYVKSIEFDYLDIFYNQNSQRVLFLLNDMSGDANYNNYYLAISEDNGRTLSISDKSKSNYLKPYLYYDNKFVGFLRKGKFLFYSPTAQDINK